ncbi:MAG: hypothetical protein Q8N47_04600 [Bryobacterales bacterium]|nr:hypothetical protein [Bryobacterales bacterium]
MKTRLICSLGAALLAAVGLYAQSSQTLVANVPFGFHVGSVALPAGEYNVDMKAAPGFVRLISADRKSAAIIGTFATQTLKYNERGKLVFNRYGDNYFLSQVWPPGVTGRGMSKSNREKEMASNAGQSARETLLAKSAK